MNVQIMLRIFLSVASSLVWPFVDSLYYILSYFEVHSFVGYLWFCSLGLVKRVRGDFYSFECYQYSITRAGS